MGSASWNGMRYYTATFGDVDLVDGDNNVSITCTSGEDKIAFDWLLITHRDLGWDINGDPQLWLDELTTHRQTQGLRVQAIDVADIYDAFSYGIISPQAIKDFITYAYDNWTKPSPKYVLIVGDASYDVKDNSGISCVTYVPSYLTFTEYLGKPRLYQPRGLRTADQSRQIPTGDIYELHGRLFRISRAMDCSKEHQLP